jgi:hypothetical protein
MCDGRRLHHIYFLSFLKKSNNHGTCAAAARLLIFRAPFLLLWARTGIMISETTGIVIPTRLLSGNSRHISSPCPKPSESEIVIPGNLRCLQPPRQAYQLQTV